MTKEFYLGGVKFIYDCAHMSDCWAYKNGGCAGNHSNCYAAPQNTIEAGEQQATGQGAPLLDNPSSAEMKLADDLQFGR